jgi:4-hydroxy-3-polyprenylbenzoate decarboxylase
MSHSEQLCDHSSHHSGAMKRIIVGISGASGAVYGIEMLKMLKELGAQTHLVITKAARITIAHETEYSVSEISALADYHHKIDDIGACISSGSCPIDGMVIAPCSVKTLAEIATGVTPSLLSRSADVILKERKPLVLMVRETPLHAGHLRNMTEVTAMGAIIAPPVPAFYTKPQSIDEMVCHNVARVLDLFGLEAKGLKRWQGLG